MVPSGAGSKGRLASGTVWGASTRPGADASRARVAAAGPRPWMASRCASACSHSCQCVVSIWRSGFPLHCRSWKAWSQWYSVVGIASWSSRWAGRTTAGHCAYTVRKLKGSCWVGGPLLLSATEKLMRQTIVGGFSCRWRRHHPSTYCVSGGGAHEETHPRGL